MISNLLDQEEDQSVGSNLDIRSRQEALRDEIRDVSTAIDKGFVKLAGLLYEVKQNVYYRDWGYLTFRDYIQYEVGISDRKGEQLVEIWGKAVALGVEPDRLNSMGWVKAKQILRVATPDTFDDWAAKAERLKIDELASEISIAKDTGVINKEIKVDKIITIKFVMNETESRVVTSAIEEAKTITQSDNIALAIVTICEDWLTNAGVVPTALNLDDRLSILEKMYNVKLEVVGLDSNATSGALPTGVVTEEELDDYDEDSEIRVLDDEDINKIMRT